MCFVAGLRAGIREFRPDALWMPWNSTVLARQLFYVKGLLFGIGPPGLNAKCRGGGIQNQCLQYMSTGVMEFGFCAESFVEC